MCRYTCSAQIENTSVYTTYAYSVTRLKKVNLCSFCNINVSRSCFSCNYFISLFWNYCTIQYTIPLGRWLGHVYNLVNR